MWRLVVALFFLLIFRSAASWADLATSVARFDIPDDPDFIALTYVPRGIAYWVYGDGTVRVRNEGFGTGPLETTRKISVEALHDLVRELLALDLVEMGIESAKERAREASRKESERTGVIHSPLDPDNFEIYLHLLNYQASPDESPVKEFRKLVIWMGDGTNLDISARRHPEIEELGNLLESVRLILSCLKEK